MPVGQPVLATAGARVDAPASRRKRPAPADVGELEALTARNPDDPKGWVLLGLAYLDRNEIRAALEAFQRAVKTGPQSAEAHNWLGVALAAKSRPAGRHRRIQEGDRARSAVRARLFEPRLHAGAERRLRRGGEGVQAGARAGAEQRRRAPESRDGASRDGRSGRRARTPAQGRGRRSAQRVASRSELGQTLGQSGDVARRDRGVPSGRSRSIRRCARRITRLATR